MKLEINVLVNQFYDLALEKMENKEAQNNYESF